jgi:hypothetical protein
VRHRFGLELGVLAIVLTAVGPAQAALAGAPGFLAERLTFSGAVAISMSEGIGIQCFAPTPNGQVVTIEDPVSGMRFAMLFFQQHTFQSGSYNVGDVGLSGLPDPMYAGVTVTDVRGTSGFTSFSHFINPDGILSGSLSGGKILVDPSAQFGTIDADLYATPAVGDVFPALHAAFLERVSGTWRCAGATRVTPVTTGNGGIGSQPLNSSQSSFGTSLPTPAAAFALPVWLAINAVVVLALVLLVVFPSQLFNLTYEQNHDQIRSWWERRMHWAARLRNHVRRIRGSRRGLAAFAAVAVTGGFLGALLDPGFGANTRTLALALGAVLAIVFGAAVTATANIAYRKCRHMEVRVELHALPTGLLIAALCVLISRVTQFQPGYLYGLVGGVVFAGHLARREEGQLVAVSSVATLIVAVSAWLIWVLADGAASRQGAGFGLAFLENFLAAVFVSGLVGLVIGLVPLRFLPGERLAAWHWGAWSAVFAVAALALLQIMLRPESATAHAASAPILVTAGLFVGFGAASILFWLYFRVRNPRAAHSRG